MSVSLLATIMWVCWGLTLLGGLGSHVLSNFNGRKLEAYCRMKRKPQLYGEILDFHDEAAVAAQYLLHFGLVVGSLAAGAWFYLAGNVEISGDQLVATVHGVTIILWVASWLIMLILAGLWLPRIVVRYSSSLFIFHSWPIWRALTAVTLPITRLGEIFSWLGQRLSDKPDDGEFEEETLEDEIRTMVAAGQRDGVFSEGVQEMIQGVMELDDAEVERIMTPRSRVDAVDLEQPWEVVIRQIIDCGRTRIPVYRHRIDNVVGILFVKDLLAGLADADSLTSTAQLESVLRKPWYIPGNKRVDELLQVFLHNRNHMAIVVDDYQQLIGVVTIEDALEEIVGEISDELDIDEDSDIYYDPDTHQVEAEGKVPVESIGKLLGVELPESDDYDTVGGLIIHRLSDIPSVGHSFELNGVRITILKASKRMIQRVRLQLIDTDDPQ